MTLFVVLVLFLTPEIGHKATHKIDPANCRLFIHKVEVVIGEEMTREVNFSESRRYTME